MQTASSFSVTITVILRVPRNGVTHYKEWVLAYLLDIIERGSNSTHAITITFRLIVLEKA